MAGTSTSALYVYYRVGDAREHARHTIASMLAELETRTGIVGRLLMRCDDAQTWMEVYEGVHDVMSFRAALEQCVKKHGVDALARDGARHVECFMPVATHAPG
jgi:hypothetical protein